MKYSQSAFPYILNLKDGSSVVSNGMTLRDYFAAQALTGAQIWDAVINGKNAQFSSGVEKLAEAAYAVADAMLAAREKE